MQSIQKTGAVLLFAILALCTGASHAGGAVLLDTFSNGSPGRYWRQFASHPAVLRTTEQNGRLEVSTTASALNAQCSAGYFADGWRLNTGADIHAKLDFKTLTTAGVSANAESTAGIAITIYSADSEPASGMPNTSLTIALGSYRYGSSVVRAFSLITVDAEGVETYLLDTYATAASPTLFKDYETGQIVAEIPVTGSLYMDYKAELNELWLSVSGYNDPDSLILSNPVDDTHPPIQIGIGGYAYKPGALAGSNAYIDNFRIDQGDIELAPATVTATDGASASGVTVTWSAVQGALGYVVYRNSDEDGREMLAELDGATTSYTDETGVVGRVYDYEVECMIGQGPPYSTSDTGWRNTEAPTGVDATDGTETSGVVVTWDENVEATSGYRVLRAIGTGAAASIGTTEATTFTDSTAIAGKAYVYTVKSLMAAGESAASTGTTGYRSLAAPANVAATDGTLLTGVNVTWAAVTGATGYRVWRSEDGKEFTSIGTPTATAFLDTTAGAGTTYTYKVSARTVAGDSIAGAPNTGWRNVAAPANVQASDGTSDAGINITWNAVAGATGYRVYRTLGAGVPVEVDDTVETGATDLEVIPGTVYSYKVYAYTDSGESAASTANTGWRNILAPTGVEAADGESTTGVALTWEAADGATGYLVFRRVGAGAVTQVASVTAATLAYNDTTAAAGTVYTYTVKARTVPGSSAASESDTGWRSLARPTVTATDGTLTTGVTVTWTAVTGAANYKVYRLVDADYVLQGTTAAAVRTYSDTGVAAGTVSTYKVCATSVAGESLGNTDTGWRNIAAPANLAASDGASTSEATLTWNAVPGATGYKVFRALGTAAATQLGTSATNGYSDASGIQGKVYTYTVKATTAAGDSSASTANTGWRNVAAPTGVAATDGTFPTKVRITWTVSPETVVTGYEVWRRIGIAAPVKIATIASRTTVAFDDVTIAIGSVGVYTVRAKTAAGVSDESASDEGSRAGGSFRSGEAEGGAETQAGAGTGGRGGSESTAVAASGTGARGGAGAGTDAAANGTQHGTAAGGQAGGTADDAVVTGAAAPTPQELVARIHARIGALERGAEPAWATEAEDLAMLAGDDDAADESPAARMLAGDLTLDGTVGADDLAAFLVAWREGDWLHADLDRDGAIDDADLLLASQAFLDAILAAPAQD